MAQGIFTRDFYYSSRTSNAGWSVKLSDKPQTVTRELLTAAIAAGVATEFKPAAKAAPIKGK